MKHKRIGDFSARTNIVLGTNSDDVLIGSNGDDLIIGGKGDDILIGAGGNDTYIFRKGDGEDKIFNYSQDGAYTEDVIRFENVAFSDTNIYREGDNLVIVYSADGSDRVYLTDFFLGDSFIINEIQFSDIFYSASELIDLANNNQSHIIYGTDGDDNLMGTDGVDIIYSNDGDDLIIGGKGDDILHGGSGNKTYLFSRGDGKDEIINYSWDGALSHDTITFTDVASHEARFFRDGNHLIIIYANDDSDQIQLTDFFLGDNYIVNSIEFTDTGYTADEVVSMVEILRNTIVGTDGDDDLIGTDGADIIYSNDGNDLIIGGKGDDILHGGRGNKTYLFSRGDGKDEIINYSWDGVLSHDSIIFTDVASHEARFFRDGNHLIIIYANDDSDQIQLTDFFLGDNYIVNSIEFTDTGYTADEVASMVEILRNTIVGTDGDDDLIGTDGADIIYSNDGNDLIIGGKGDDILHGGRGNKTYLFSRGDGKDEIINYSWDGVLSHDSIIFTDVASHEARFFRDGNHLIIIYANDDSDQIQLTDFFLGDNYIVNSIEFTDTGYTADEVASMVEILRNTIVGTDGDDDLIGTDGADIIYSNDGNDLIIGGKGDDILHGGRGNKTYLFSRGDGKDEIINYSWDGVLSHDSIIFTDVASHEARFFRDGNHLIIIYANDDSDQIQLTDFFLGDNYIVNSIEFTDTGYTADEVASMVEILRNTIVGTDGDDDLIGTDGADIIYSNDGNDLIIGGKGDDILHGGRGNKTYLFSRGDGKDEIINYSWDGVLSHDSIIFTDVASHEARFFRDGNHLIIIYANDDSDQIQLTDFFLGDNYIVNSIEFTDTGYLADELASMVEPLRNTIVGTDGDDVLHGTDGDDIIYGNGGDDLLYGGKGDDVLIGGSGNNTYAFQRGHGSDEIINYSPDGEWTVDVVDFEDISYLEANFRREGNNLVITYSPDGSDRVQLTDFFLGENYAVNYIQFADYTYSADEFSVLVSETSPIMSSQIYDAAFVSVDQELHSLINAMAAFDPVNNHEESLVTDDPSLVQPLITTSSF